MWGFVVFICTPQTFNLLPTMTAVENVETPMVMAGFLSAKERRSRARDLLNRVGMGTHSTPLQCSIYYDFYSCRIA